MRLRPFTSLLSVGIVAGALLVTSSAHAEAGRAPPRCGVNVVPSNSTLVPANLPAIVASPSPTAEGAQRVTITALGGIDGTAEGTSFAEGVERQADPRVRGATLFVPTSPFPEGTTFEVGFDVDCDGIDTTSLTRFVTGAPRDLPTAMGTVTTRAGQPPQGAEIFVDPTPELLAFLPVTMFELETRAGTVTLASYGQAQLAGGGRVRVESPAVFPLLLCDVNEPGSHIETVSLRAHVAGAETDPPAVAFDMAITCDASHIPQIGDPQTDSDPEGVGCSTSRESPSTGAPTFVLGALALVTTRRRRRGRLKATSAR